MKLDHDVVRKFLLAIEENNDLFGLSSASQSKFAKDNNLTDDELAYIILKLYDGDIVNGKPLFASNAFYTYTPVQLTFKGHEYLDNIRSPEVWSRSKKIAGKIGSVSLDVMATIASKVIAELINKNMQ